MPLVLPKVMVITAIAGVSTWLRAQHFLPSLPLPVFTVAGLALGLALTFRLNASYDRFWEGRKAWGNIINRSRNLARQLSMLLPSPEAGHGGALIVTFAHALKRQLWREAQVPEANRLLGESTSERLYTAPGPSQTLLILLSRLVHRSLTVGAIDSNDAARLEADIAHLTDQMGVCERIKNTPIPVSFVIYLRRMLLGYCVALPLALYEEQGLFAPLVVAMAALVFLSVDRIGVEIEDPFERSPNDIDLEGLCEKIERDVGAIMGMVDHSASLNEPETF